MSHLLVQLQLARLTRLTEEGIAGGMTTHTATVQWARGDSPFRDSDYRREHQWHFDGGATVIASASPQRVPLPFSTEAAVDPEEAFVASLSSCHMLWFLALASKEGLVLDSYVDDASGVLKADAEGLWSMTEVVLRPKVTAAVTPERSVLEKLHHRAHEACFLARSVKCTIRVEL